MTAKQGQPTMSKIIKLTALLTLSALSFSAFAEVNAGTGFHEGTAFLDIILGWLLNVV